MQGTIYSHQPPPRPTLKPREKTVSEEKEFLLENNRVIQTEVGGVERLGDRHGVYKVVKEYIVITNNTGETDSFKILLMQKDKMILQWSKEGYPCAITRTYERK